MDNNQPTSTRLLLVLCKNLSLLALTTARAQRHAQTRNQQSLTISFGLGAFVLARKQSSWQYKGLRSFGQTDGAELPFISLFSSGGRNKTPATLAQAHNRIVHPDKIGSRQNCIADQQQTERTATLSKLGGYVISLRLCKAPDITNHLRLDDLRTLGCRLHWHTASLCVRANLSVAGRRCSAPM